MMSVDEKTCPQCAEQVKLAAKVCKHCGHTFTTQENADALQAAGGGNTAIGCVVLVLLVLGIAMCSGGDDESEGDLSDVDAAAANVEAAAEAALAEVEAGESPEKPIKERSAWSYSESKDELRGKTTYHARVVSDNSVQFDFPYNGGARLTMTVRKSPQYGSDVIFRISKGQYTCGLYNCKGAISFDGRSEALTLTTPADHSSDVLFATYGDAIIRKLKNSDRTIVELPFYQEGNRQFVFDTTNLEWPPE